MENSSSQKTKKEAWQLEILQQYYADGMTATGKSHLPQLELASQATSLTLQVVKDWVLNQRKPDRNSKGLSGRINAYTAFAREFKNDLGLSLGELAKERAKQYQELKATPEGQEELQAMLEMQKKIVPTPRDIQAQISKLLKKMEDCNDQLQSLGVFVTSVVAEKGKKPAVLGCEEGTFFFGAKKDLLYQYAERVLQSQGVEPIVSSDDCRATLRKKVQQLFNIKFMEQTGKKMSYRAVEDNTLGYAATNMPEGIVLKKPSMYAVAHLKKLLENGEAIRFVPRHNAEDLVGEPTPGPSVDDSEVRVEESEEIEEGLTLKESEGGQVLHFEIQNNAEEEMHQGEDEMENLVVLQDVQTAEEVIQQVEQSLDKRTGMKRRHTIEVEMLWDVEGVNKWYKGMAKKCKGGHLQVRWEDGQTTKVKKGDVESFESLGKFRFSSNKTDLTKNPSTSDPSPEQPHL